MEVALNNVTIFLSRVEIDPDREAAEIEKSLHLGADPGRQAKDVAALPGDVEAGLIARGALSEIRHRNWPKSWVSSLAF